MNDYGEPETFRVVKYDSRWRIRGIGAREPHLHYGVWWIGDNGIPFLKSDTVTKSWKTKEEAEAALDKILLESLLAPQPEWNDHE